MRFSQSIAWSEQTVKCANAKCTFTFERDINGARNILLEKQELVFGSALRPSSLTVGFSESPVVQSASVNVSIISIPSNAALTL